MLSLSRFAMFSLPVLVLLSADPVFANPKSRTFNAPADDVFRAAQKGESDSGPSYPLHCP